MKKLSRIASIFCVLFNVQIIILVIISDIIDPALRLGFNQFPNVFSVLMFIHVISIATYAIPIICLPFVMFYITCFMFKMKFKEITKDVEKILDEPFIHVSRVSE